MSSTPVASPPRARWGMRIGVSSALLATCIATLATVTLGGGSLAQSTVYAITTTSFLVAGWLIAERRRGNLVGPLVIALGLLVSAYIVLDAWIRLPGSRPGSTAAALAVNVADGLYFFIIAMLFAHFPDGRLPGPRWRILVGVTATLATVTFLGALMRPGPLPYYAGFDNPLDPPANSFSTVWEIAYAAMVGCVVVAAFSLFVRWQRGGVIERAQLKWVASAAVLVAAAMVTYGAGTGPGRYSEVGDLTVGVALGLFPVAIGIAVLRYRLYEIDRLISRTIGWAIVTAVLVATFAGLVVVLQAALAPVTNENTLAVAASTLVAFALFQPVRRRVQRAVDRRFDRARYDAQATADAFAERLRGQVDLDGVEEDLGATVGTALSPASARIWLRGNR